MNLGESIRRNTLWILTGGISGQLITFAAGVVLARLLAPEDFGLLVTISIFTGILSFVAAGGMGEALVQAKQVDEDDYRVVFTIQLLVCLLIYLGIYYIAPWFSIWFKNELYMDLLRVAALTFLIRPFTNIPRARLKRAMQFKVIALSRLTGMIVGSITSITLALMDMGTWALIYGGLAGPFINTALIYYYTRWRPGIRFIPSVARRLGSYGIKMSLNSIIFYLRKQTSNLIISHQLGPSLLGLFNKADSLSTLPAQMVGGSAYQTVFRALSSEQENLVFQIHLYPYDRTRSCLYLTVLHWPAMAG
jgi:teichuronic acid exporter